MQFDRLDAEGFAVYRAGTKDRIAVVASEYLADAVPDLAWRRTCERCGLSESETCRYASLFAAAPAMFEALMRYASDPCAGPLCDWSARCRSCNARAVLAHARGETAAPKAEETRVRRVSDYRVTRAIRIPCRVDPIAAVVAARYMTTINADALARRPEEMG